MSATGSPAPRDQRRALLLSYSVIAGDPRVRRQIDWLSNAGWTIDTVGLGEHPAPIVREHFALRPPSKWITTKTGVLATHMLLSSRRIFDLQVVQRIPQVALDRIRSGHYGLLVLNETEFTPLVGDPRFITAESTHPRVHLDLHEYHNPAVRRRTLGGRLTGRHYRWVRRHIGHARVTTRSVVNAPIGRLYAEEFGFAEPTPVRNAPPFVEQNPSAGGGEEIRLLFHGLAAWQRGFSEILEAMRALPERFTMTFMLMPNPVVVDALQRLIDEHPARDRIRIVPPAPMPEIAERVNEYDLEIIFYRPLGPNLLYALPNKFFEALQGRLGVVVGESPAMAEIVREYGSGVVVGGFEASQLADALSGVTRETVQQMKAAADRAARKLNAEGEGAAFLETIEAAVASRDSQ